LTTAMLGQTISGNFTGWDWAVLAGYLVFTTIIGSALAGKQATIRDFFLGGRKLPWYAVSGSIVATEISALTFVSVPWVVFQPGGNFTYLQLGVFGSFFARILVGYVLVPAYYKREIYSPYDYMQNQLGGNVRTMTTSLFALSGMLAQSARIYLTAEVLNVILHDQLVWLSASFGLNPLAWSIILIALVSVSWTLIGGITTVIWTDVVLFIAFLLGAMVSLVAVAWSLNGGWGELFRVGWDAKLSGFPSLGLPMKESGAWGKFTFFDWSVNPARRYTMWTAVIASTWGGLGAYGTDQLMAQRMFCCRDARRARWAIISSVAGQVVTLTVAMIGVGLYAYYKANPLNGQALELFQKNGDRIFPIFIVDVIPVGLKGLIIAAIFAAAISSVMGILTALSQTVQKAFYNPLRERYLRSRGIAVELTPSAEHAAEAKQASAEDRRSVRVGRLLVVFWGVVLSLLAYFASKVGAYYPSILDLGLAMAGYCGGALLAGFVLGFLPLRVNGRGFMYSAPLSVMCVFAVLWHQPWTHVVCGAFAVLLLAIWVRQLSHEPTKAVPLVHSWLQTLILIGGLGLLMWLSYYGYWHVTDEAGNMLVNADGTPVIRTIAWPWQIPLGSLVAFIWGYLLAHRKPPEE
jgi:SSS family solute:Na+ symporter